MLGQFRALRSRACKLTLPSASASTVPAMAHEPEQRRGTGAPMRGDEQRARERPHSLSTGPKELQRTCQASRY